jgi:hypothetical protein
LLVGLCGGSVNDWDCRCNRPKRGHDCDQKSPSRRRKATHGTRSREQRELLSYSRTTDGFPNNPAITSLIRDEVAARGLLKSPDIAPVEIMDLTEIDMVEGLAEGTGPALPDVLKLKHQSNFRADSVRNFLAADPRFSPRRPRRVAVDFKRVLSEIIAALGGKPEEFDWRE